MTTPASVNESIERLRAKIGAAGNPVYVGVSKASFASENECHENVSAHVKTHGGSAVRGWCVWEESGLLIEGMFHSVWRSPSGKLVDITPQRDGETRVLFIPDDRPAPASKVVNSIRLPLVDSPEVHHSIRLQDAIFALRVAHPDGVAAEKFVQAVSDATLQTDGCPCGSGRPFGICHKSARKSEQLRAWSHLIQ